MRRRWLYLIGALVLVLGLSAPAGAAKPQCDPDLPNYTPKHPQCQSDDSSEELPPGGTVCDPGDYPEGIDGVQYDDFTFTLGSGDGPFQASVCVDVVSNEGPWSVTITGHGAKNMVIIPRDSAGPGESCGGYRRHSSGQIYGSSPLVLGFGGVVPAATINACGVEFAEWVDLTTPGLIPEVHCAAFDEAGRCLVTEQVDVTHPLVLLVHLSGSGSTTFEVDLP